MDTKEIFDAEALATGQFLQENGQGLYIPPYQREYSWEPAKAERLLSDVTHGLEQLLTAADSICFIGSVIALRDTNYTTVEPIHRTQVPHKVMTIIDGQQRLTTLLLTNTALHEVINRAVRKFSREVPAQKWLLDNAADVSARLVASFEEDKSYGDHRYYPRMIRAYHDVWSRNEGEAKYVSPIANHLRSYGAYARGADYSKQFAIAPPEGLEGDALNAHNHLIGMHKGIRRNLGHLVAGRSLGADDAAIPDLGSLLNSVLLQEALFNGELPGSVAEDLEADVELHDAFRAIVLANYVLFRVTLAVVTAKREEYGFDMFEALNTTGEPLTALETFKPRVILAEGAVVWKNSKSKADFDVLDSYMAGEGSSTDQRQSATSSILIPFALIHNGSKLGKRLNAQRTYLRTNYDALTGIEEKRRFLHRMSDVARFISGPWRNARDLETMEPSALAAEAALAMRVLSSAGHDIVIAPLTVYFSAWRKADEQSVETRTEELLNAIRASAAFFALYRGGNTTTARIDERWRSAMSGTPGAAFRLAAGDRAIEELPSSADLAEYLKGQLHENGLGSRDEWVKRASGVPTYKVSRALTRFLLLAAADDGVPDAERPGLIKRGMPGVRPMLTLGNWEDDSLSTVEHVAPEVPAGSWSSMKEVYDPAEPLIHSLGNLTLMPQIQNSSAGNREWPVKHLMYRALSSETIEEAELLLAQAAEQGLDLGKSSTEVVQSSRHLPMLRAIAQQDLEWSADVIRERSQRMCELAYDRLTAWLQPQP